MANTSTDGQATARLLARACRALVEDGVVSTEGLLAAYRALDPAGHDGARADALDVAFIARCRSLGGDALLRAPRIVVEAALPRTAPVVLRGDDGTVRLRAPASEDAPGNALALALGVSLEAAKLAHGLGAPADVLRAAFATPNDAKAALDALAAGGAGRSVELPPLAPRVDANALRELVGDRPTYVVTGAGASRMHDLLSPYARRLRDDLVALGRDRGAPRDEELYVAVDELLADEHVHAERLAAEARDGFTTVGPGVIAVRCDALPDAETDRRVKDAAIGLKRGRALFVLVEGNARTLADTLDAVGAACRAVVAIVDATAEATPAWARDLATDHVCAVDNAFEARGTITTLPSLGLRGKHRSGSAELVDTAAFALVQAAQRARAGDVIPAASPIGLRACAHGDVSAMSRACIDVLLRLRPSQQAKGRR